LIALDIPEQMVVNTPQVTIKGEIRPQTRVEINGQPIELPPQFAHVITLPEGEHDLTVKGVSPEGNEQTLPLMITVDMTPPEIRLENVPASTREPALNIAGWVSEAATVSLDGVVISEQGQQFTIPLLLKEGDNRFVLEAVDRAGNVATTTIRTVLDTIPPDITNAVCLPPKAQGGEIITCEVRAEDTGIGLAKTGSFYLVVSPGMQLIKGILTFSRTKSIFEGSVFIPAGVTGDVSIREVRIQDRLKNEATSFESE
jgi:hypothetical protein